MNVSATVSRPEPVPTRVRVSAVSSLVATIPAFRRVARSAADTSKYPVAVSCPVAEPLIALAMIARVASAEPATSNSPATEGTAFAVKTTP